MKCGGVSIKEFARENRIVLIRYRDSKIPGLKKYSDLLGMDYDDVIMELERREQEGRYWGILLGRPSGYLLMLDFDNEELGELTDSSPSAAKELKERLAREAIAEIGYEPCMLVLSKRGFHLIYRVTEDMYERLVETVGGNKTKILEWEKDGYVFDVDVLLKGATPVSTDRHELACVGSCSPGNVVGELLLKLVGTGGKSEEGEGERIPITVVEPGRDCKELSERDAEEMKLVLSRYWRKGYRNSLELGLVGFCIKNNVCESSCCSLVERIATVARDEELRKRVADCKYQYERVRKGELPVEELRGISEVEEIVRKLAYEETGSLDDAEIQARMVRWILYRSAGRKTCPYVESMIETGLKLVNYPGKGILLVREGKSGRRIRYLSYLYVVDLSESVIEPGTYGMVLSGRSIGEYKISGSLLELEEELKKLPGIAEHRNLRDWLSVLITGFKMSGCIRESRFAQASGVYMVDGNPLPILHGSLSVSRIERNREMAAAALELLERMRNFYDPMKFDSVMQWMAYAPFGYMIKREYGARQLYLLLFGEKKTGKTTLARIVRETFAVRELRHGEDIVSEEGFSPYRLGYLLSLTTFPVLVDEVQGISQNKVLTGMLKRAASGIIARWRGDLDVRFYARSSLILTSNYEEIIEDPALRDRILSIRFTSRDSVARFTKEERRKFEELRAKYLKVGRYLGYEIVMAVVEEWDVLSKLVYELQEKDDYLEFGRRVWELVGKRLGREVPWAGSIIRSLDLEPDDAERSPCSELLDRLREYIMRNFGGRYMSGMKFSGILAYLDSQGLLPSWMKTGKDYLALHPSCLKELGIETFGGLKNLCESCGWRYDTVRFRPPLGKKKGCLVPISVLS